MGAGWRIDGSGVADVLDRGESDARMVSGALSLVAVSLDEVAGLLDDGVGAALRRLDERWQESASSVDRRTVAVVEAARTVVRDHLAADDEMVGHFGAGLLGDEGSSSRFAPRIAL